MIFKLSPLVALPFLLATLAPMACAQTGEKSLPYIKVVLAGDSTVAPNGGWGPGFAKFLSPLAQCVNLAKGGRSSKSFRDEGFWDEVIKAKPTYVLVQFGHNDQPGKGPERETEPNTTYSQNLARYVDEARAIGAQPILVTSLTRRHFVDGKIASDLTSYAEAAKKVAAQKNVPLIDLHARSIEELNAIGPEAAAPYNFVGADKTKIDRTHLSEIGGEKTALLVAREVKKVVPELGRYVLIPSTQPAAFPPVQNPKTITVAGDGSGDYKTVQEAIAALPDKSATRTIVHIKPGVYQGQIILPASKTNVSFQGDDTDSTILTLAINTNEEQPAGIEPRYKGTGVVILADGFRADKITFQNTSGDHGQALALRIDGDRAAITNCRLLGWQDTLMVNKARQYFQHCYIEGRVDFIYGSGTTFFDRCEIRSKNGGYVTAASTPQEQAYGFVFNDCVLTGSADAWIDPTTGNPPEGRKPGAQAFLGRPWRPYGNVAFINCRMGDHIKPEGWNNWRNAENEKTARYSEFGSLTAGGNPLDVSKRVAWAKVLTSDKASNYTKTKVLGGWNPDTEIDVDPNVTIPITAPIVAPNAMTATPAASPISRPMFVLAGDSTVTDNAGWGLGFKNLLKPEVALVNLAKGGRSSKSFRDEGSWQKALDLKPQYVLIQFGHNDQPGHGPERESDAATTFKTNISRYVDDARAVGITPILVTPMSRREFKAGGKIQSSLAPYADSVRAVASEKKVPLVDLHTRSLALFNELGPEGVRILSPLKEGGAFDGTHLNTKGSELVAPLLADELRKAVPALAPVFK